MVKYTIGLDFGTLSVRGVLVNVSNGDVLYSSVSNYASSVMDEFLVYDNTLLPNDFALQDANDYITSMLEVITNITKNSGVQKDDIIGIGVDFTASTIMPVDQLNQPLSVKYPKNRHAYAKLWKHHHAEPQAKRITELAIKRNEPWIQRYGEKISSEWMLPKVLEILENDYDLFQETDMFIEAGDFIVRYLTNTFARSSCQAGYKNIWHNVEGYPSNDYLMELNPKLDNLYSTKLRGDVVPIGKCQGHLSSEIAESVNLNEIAVSVSVIDAHVAAPSCRAVNPGDMLMIIGTSSCDILLSEEEHSVKGISGIVKDGAIPDLFAYESGQAAVGDIFQWFMENLVPSEYATESKKRDISLYQYMEEKVNQINEDTPRLLALDWWNGNRSILVNPELTGVIVGMTLKTKPEEIFRALIEATGFGKKRIIEQYENAGVPVSRIIASGGLATKNKYLMQTYANILNKSIYVTDEEYAGSVGAAIFGSLAAGKHIGGYDNIKEASFKMGSIRNNPYVPTNTETYEELYKSYIELHDYFGIKSDILKKLKHGGNYAKKNTK